MRLLSRHRVAHRHNKQLSISYTYSHDATQKYRHGCQLSFQPDTASFFNAGVTNQYTCRLDQAQLPQRWRQTILQSSQAYAQSQGMVKPHWYRLWDGHINAECGH